MRKLLLSDVPESRIAMINEMFRNTEIFDAWSKILSLPRPASRDDWKAIEHLAAAWKNYFDLRDQWLKDYTSNTLKLTH